MAQEHQPRRATKPRRGKLKDLLEQVDRALDAYPFTDLLAFEDVDTVAHVAAFALDVAGTALNERGLACGLALAYLEHATGVVQRLAEMTGQSTAVFGQHNGRKRGVT